MDISNTRGIRNADPIVININPPSHLSWVTMIRNPIPINRNCQVKKYQGTKKKSSLLSKRKDPITIRITANTDFLSEAAIIVFVVMFNQMYGERTS